ncbi:MAG TPA: hypothetical protein VNN07_17300, partial [Candidatus Tectomicrobia bacterium]|nr:hypothetical protein [Candidatus Tectomicrobia bacterium]
ADWAPDVQYGYAMPSEVVQTAEPRPLADPAAVIVVPPGSTVAIDRDAPATSIRTSPSVRAQFVAPTDPVMCPGINVSDPRPC